MIEIKNTLNTEINIEIYTSIHTGNINTYRDIYKHTHYTGNSGYKYSISRCIMDTSIVYPAV